MFNNIFKTFISTIAFLILCISIYLAILVSFDFFDQDHDSLTRVPMDPHMDMMKRPMDPHMDMMKRPMDPRMDMMKRPMDIREMTADDYDLLIKQLELEKKFIDLEIQRLITEKNK
ncbi:MAG: hypothetical protein CL772_02355 [Chloroflexi bacterium]|nr:hypothetical protein [Chloroflexota bacterium]|tara:strand:+ start:43964 stop:44311 length:348 start_codon:yes stop_codon:yes gene_type:complete